MTKLSVESNEYVAFIKSQGFDVYAPEKGTTYCFFTDGEKIAYAQWGKYGFGVSVSSVHGANRTTGTGYQVADAITAQSLREALDCVVPSWATSAERKSVKKYASLDAFLKSYWTKLVKVEA